MIMYLPYTMISALYFIFVRHITKLTNPTLWQATGNYRVKNGTFKILNASGENVYSDELKSTSQKEINLVSQPTGIYFLEIKSEGELFYGKILKH